MIIPNRNKVKQIVEENERTAGGRGGCITKAVGFLECISRTLCMRVQQRFPNGTILKRTLLRFSSSGDATLVKTSSPFPFRNAERATRK